MKTALRPASVVLLAGLLSVLVMTTPGTALLFSSGPPNFVASSPFGSYANCTGCHSTFAVNSGNGALVINGLPATYTPGVTYPVQIQIGDPGQSRWGYEFTVLDDNDMPIGTLTNPDANSQIGGGGGGPQFAKHRSGGTFAGVNGGPVAWTVDWVAPAAGAGKARFYSSGNAANNNNNNFGDFIYSMATTTAEAGSGHSDGTIVGQPHTIFLNPGASRLTVPMRVTNHLPGNQNYFVVTRVRRPNGTFIPATGWLSGPTQVSLASGETTTVILDKAVPANTPAGIYQLQCIIGYQGNILVNRDNIDVTVN